MKAKRIAKGAPTAPLKISSVFRANHEATTNRAVSEFIFFGTQTNTLSMSPTAMNND